MVPEDRKGHKTGPNIEMRCKIDTVASANTMPISVFRRLCTAMLDFTGKALEKFDSDSTTLTVQCGATIKQFRLRVFKSMYNKKKWKCIFHSVDAQGPVLIDLRTPRQTGIFNKHPMVYIETVVLCSSQLKEGR